jgi:hypothetical protein
LNLALPLAALLAAAPQQTKLALGSLSTVNVPADLASFVMEHLAEELRGRGFRVTTSGDMAAILGLERQKQLLGCTDTGSSCMAELASALGVDAIVAGEFAKLGATYQLDLKVLSAKNGARLTGWSENLKDEALLTDALHRASKAIADAVPTTPAVGRPPEKPVAVEIAAPTPEPESRPLRGRAWIPALAGGICLVGGGISYGLGKSDYNALKSGQQITPQSWADRQSRGPVLEGGGVFAMVLGAAGLATAATFYFWPTRASTPQIAVGPGGVFVGGSLP